MKTTTLRILMIALVALLALTMVGCKGESSPTAPPTTSTVPPGGVTPPAGASVTLTVSNATPLVNSQVKVTATVTQNGSAVPDGTAVQFTTTIGTFSDTGQNTTIRTTTAGVATATLSSASAGTATITATVNNVSKTTTVTFSTVPVTPPLPNTAPTITSVCVVTGSTCTTPATGIPAGGQQVVITGTNFRQPVRVLFDPGNGQPAKEAFVSSVTATQIVVVAPPFDIVTGQTLPVTITVIDEAGTAVEQKVSAQNAFTYQLAVLTPSVRTLTPTSGPIDGGTSVAILGDAFQAPVQVFFGAAEAQVIKVQFNEIDVISPTARDTSPAGSGAVTGPVDIKVRNVGSGKEATFPAGFRYIAKMQITAFGPGSGTAFGGTRVTIDGVGFNDPVTVSIGGIVATPIKVSGTQVIARTGRTPIPCTPPSGPVIITNVDNGDQANTLPTVFVYQAEKPLITDVSPLQAQPGQSVQITLIKPGVGLNGNAFIRFTFTSGSAVFTVFPTPSEIFDPEGPLRFTVNVPSPPASAFPSQPCTTGGGLPGTQPGPLTATLTFLNVTTGCTDTVTNFQILPLVSTCTATAPPPAAVVSPTTFCPSVSGFGNVTIGNNSSQLLTVSNTASGTGAQSLLISNAVISGPNSSEFSVTPTTATIPAGQSAPFTIKFTPIAPTGAKTATLRLFTNDPARPTIDVPLCGTAQ